MKKLSFIAVFMAALTIIGFSATGCSDKKPAAVADSANTDTLVADTQAMDSTEALIEETPMPKAADELFDDFIFNFAANCCFLTTTVSTRIWLRNHMNQTGTKER